jgi:hypothetical protein
MTTSAEPVGAPRTRGTPPEGIFLLGMHRSGTSAFSRALNLLGLRLGAEDDLMPATDANAHGYWESTSLTAVNDALLAAAGGRWDIPPAFHGHELVRQLQPHRESAYRAFTAVYGEAGTTWLWKDPRNCLLLPFWERLLGLEGTPLALVYRHPLEVARSLAVRDGFPLPLGLALWETYTHACLSAAADRSVFVASYEGLVADPETWCIDATTFLADVGVDVGRADLAQAAGSVDHAVRHAAHVRQELIDHRAVSAEQVALFDFLESHNGAHDCLPAHDSEQTPWVPVLHESRRAAIPPVPITESAFRGAAQVLDRQSARADLTVCITTTGGGQQLIDCLESVLEGPASCGILDVLVVDNGTTDETLQILGALSQDVRSIRHERPVAPTTAWASGAELAEGAAILFMSTDVRLTSDATRALLRQLETAEGPLAPRFSARTRHLPSSLGAEATTCVLVPRRLIARADDVPRIVTDAQATTSDGD